VGATVLGPRLWLVSDVEGCKTCCRPIALSMPVDKPNSYRLARIEALTRGSRAEAPSGPLSVN